MEDTFTLSLKEVLGSLADYNRILVAGIEYEDLASFPGISTSVFLQGCNIHCKGCFNSEVWGTDGGVEWSTSDLYKSITQSPIVKQIVWLGGEPTLQARNILPVVHKLKDNGYSQVLFTGHKLGVFKRLMVQDSALGEVVRCMNYVKIGPYIKELYDPDLKYRGSSNQEFYKVENGKLLKVDVMKL